MAKSNIFKEVLAESKSLKKAALKNAQDLLAESFKDTMKEMVEAELNEADDQSEGDDEDTMDESLGYDDPSEHDTMSEMMEEDDVDMDDDLDLGGDGDGDEDDLDLDMGDDEGLDESLGFSEEDLQEAIQEALMSEVDHGQMGEMEELTPDKHDTGLMDKDSKESGWEEKTPPAKKDFTVKESAYKQKIAALVVENKSLKKALKQLKESVDEINLFNRKLFFVNKLLDKAVVRERKDLKREIIKQLDQAKTLGEAQSVYKSLSMVVGLVSEGKAAKSKKATTLSETLGYQARNERGISKVDQERILNEGDAKFSPRRLQFLAGIAEDE